jgi:hypothetical protein
MAISKNDNRSMVKLQNLLFGTNEHQLMVTPAFLNQCTKIYIVKHLRAINTCMQNIKITKNPALFYSSLPPLREHLDNLIKIEPYYDMTHPTPSTFLKEFEQNRNVYATNMIKRYVHETKQHVPNPATLDNPLVRKYFQDAFNSLMVFEDQMQVEEKNMVDVFYSGIFKRNFHDPIPEGGDVIEPGGEIPTDEALEESTGGLSVMDMPGIK